MKYLFTIGFVAVVASGLMILAWIIAFCIQKRQDFRRKKHPEFYKRVEERDELVKQLLKILNEYSSKPKKEIDNLISNMRYCTQEERTKSYQRIEELQYKIAKTSEMTADISKEITKLDNFITEYAKIYKLEKHIY